MFSHQIPTPAAQREYIEIPHGLSQGGIVARRFDEETKEMQSVQGEQKSNNNSRGAGYQRNASEAAKYVLSLNPKYTA
jgi:hypothetical protein